MYAQIKVKYCSLYNFHATEMIFALEYLSPL